MTVPPSVRFLLAPSAPALLLAVFLAPGCNGGATSQSLGLRSCFDTGASVVCQSSAALSTADQDVDHDGVPDKFVCADDDDDGHDRDRDRDHSGAIATKGDEDHDGVDDDLDCDHRVECKPLSNEENEHDRSGATATSAEHGDDHGGSDDHDGGDRSGSDDHPETGCKPPTITPPPPGA